MTAFRLVWPWRLERAAESERCLITAVELSNSGMLCDDLTSEELDRVAVKALHCILSGKKDAVGLTCAPDRSNFVLADCFRNKERGENVMSHFELVRGRILKLCLLQNDEGARSKVEDAVVRLREDVKQNEQTFRAAKHVIDDLQRHNDALLRDGGILEQRSHDIAEQHVKIAKAVSELKQKMGATRQELFSIADSNKHVLARVFEHAGNAVQALQEALSDVNDVLSLDDNDFAVGDELEHVLSHLFLVWIALDLCDVAEHCRRRKCKSVYLSTFWQFFRFSPSQRLLLVSPMIVDLVVSIFLPLLFRLRTLSMIFTPLILRSASIAVFFACCGLNTQRAVKHWEVMTRSEPSRASECLRREHENGALSSD